MLSKIDRFDTFVAEREANKDWQNFLSRDCSSILTIMKPLATPRQMKDAVREAAERGRSNF
jgi:hypothetical protein